MGYCINMKDCKFNMDAKNKELALKAVQNFMKGKISLGWIIESEVMESKTFEDFMEIFSYPVDCDKVGNVNSISFYGEKLGSELDFFEVIAPYVKNGSYIEMHGEDGAIWRWIFNGKKCIEKSAKISW